MLLRFAVRNFRSFRDEQEVSLVASAIKELPDAVVRFDGLAVGVLRVLALYGANASGKTNLIRAMSFMRSAVGASQRRWAPDAGVPREPFLLDQTSSSKPSSFETDLLIAGVRYTYGFELDSKRVLGEWLYAYPNGKRQTWFERSADVDAPIKFGKNLSGENRAIESLTRTNSLFLSAAAQNGHQQLLPVYKWFAGTLEIVTTASRQALWMSTAQLYEEGEHRAALVSLLSAADLGIVDVEITKEEVDEKLQSAIKSLITSISDAETGSLEDTRLPPMPRIRLKHESGDGSEGVSLSFADESDGTRALFAIFGPVMRVLASGGALFIDELDASLHPNLAIRLVRMFNESVTNPRNAQLIFNTHDTNLLDGKVLRRDQVWFAEKEKSGATQLYPLSDFQPRKGENLERGYLQGRFGAVPFMGALSDMSLVDG